MKLKINLFGLLFFIVLGCGCSDSENPIIPGVGSESDYEIVASPIELNITLKSYKMVTENEKSVLKVLTWKNGAGKLLVSLGNKYDIDEVDVDKDGNCKIIFPEKLKFPYIQKYVPYDKGLVHSPNTFLTSYVRSTFVFKPFDDPSTIYTDESKIYQKPICPRLLSEDSSEVVRNYSFIMSEAATVKGTFVKEETRYNCSYKHGWNIETWNYSGDVIEHTVVGHLPAEVVWM